MGLLTLLTTRHSLFTLLLFSFSHTSFSTGAGGSPALYINPQPQSCPASYYQCTTINQPSYCCPYNEYCYQDVTSGPSCCPNNVQCANYGQNTVAPVAPVTQLVSTSYYPTTTTIYPSSTVYTTPQTITSYYTGGQSVATVVAVAGNPATSTIQTTTTTQSQALSTCQSTLTAQGGNLPAVQTQANGQLLCIVRAGVAGRSYPLNGRAGLYLILEVVWMIVCRL